MAVFPHQGDIFALALNEPALLVPGAKPSSRVRLKAEWRGRVKRGFACNDLRNIADGTLASVVGATCEVKPLMGFGLGWTHDTGTSSYFNSNSKTVGADGNNACSDIVVFVSDINASAISYICSVVNNGASFIDDIAINCNQNESALAGSVYKVFRGTGGLTTRAATGDIGIDDGALHAMVWSFDGANILSVAVDGAERSLTYGVQADVVQLPAEAGYDYWYLTRNVRNASSVGAQTGVGIFLHLRLSGELTQAERAAISFDPWGTLFEPANDIPYLATVSDGSITGTGAGTLEAIVGSASGSVVGNYAGTAAGSLQAIVGSASGTFTAAGFTGTAAGVLQAITGSASGVLAYSGTASGALAAITGSATGSFSSADFIGSGAGTLAAITGAASGTFTPLFQGSGSGVLQAITAAATGAIVNNVTGTAAGALSAITAAGAGSISVDVVVSGDHLIVIGPENRILVVGPDNRIVRFH